MVHMYYVQTIYIISWGIHWANDLQGTQTNTLWQQVD